MNIKKTIFHRNQYYLLFLKNSKMGAYWVIMNVKKQILMEKELYSKSWYINTVKTAKAFILLDFVMTIYTKLYSTTHRNINVCFDNSKVWKMLNGGMITFN